MYANSVLGIIREELVTPCPELSPSAIGRREGRGVGGGRGMTAEKSNAHFTALYFCKHPQHNSPIFRWVILIVCVNNIVCILSLHNLVYYIL
jgi:hypothetical protein